MRDTIWNKRIPTLVGIMILTIGIGITSFLVGKGTIFISQAGPSQSPQNIRITNISDNSLTVTYTTSDSVLGSVNFGRDKNLGQTALDDRDQQHGSVVFHTVHSITVQNLLPSTTYHFTIESGQNTFLNNGVPFIVSTGPSIQSSSLINQLTGKVALPNGSSPKEALVYVTTNNAQTLSALVKPDGRYILPLGSLRTKDLSSYIGIGGLKNSVIQMLIVGANSLRSNVLLSGKNLGKVPVIVLGNNYDFTVNNLPVSSASAVPISFPPITLGNPSSASKSPEIILPKKDQGFSDQQPQFKGAALPNSNVEIIIHSATEIQAQVKTDGFGNWVYRPSTPLSPGQHIISIITRDASGILRTVTQSFVVYASGTQIAGAVPSTAPTPTNTPAPTEAPTPTSVPSLTPTPTPTLTPTPTPTPTPTIAPTVPINSPTPLLSTKTPLGNSNILIAGIFGVAVTILGGFLFLLTRGNI